MMQNDPTEIHPPWYRQFWPWVLIAIPALTVVGSAVTLWLALTHPDTLVVDEVEYRQIRSELRVQEVPGADPAAETPGQHEQH